MEWSIWLCAGPELLASAAVGALVLAALSPAGATQRDYRFDGEISREVLHSYLARAVTAMDLLNGKGDIDDNIRMLTRIGAKFAGRAVYRWGAEADLPGMLARAAANARKVHAADPEMILQAGIFEIVTRGIEHVRIPQWVFEQFDLVPEGRPFSYQAMLFPDGRWHDHWGKGASVPDMCQLETRMWFYYLAVEYINLGCEAIHFGQVHLIGADDKGMKHWWDMLSRVRAYASEHARRHMVLCDAHTHGVHYQGDRLVFDLHSYPLRIQEVPERPQEGILQMGYLDSIFGKSAGGLTPSGWRCESLPYLVELDNWGSSGKEGQAIGDWWTWGYDEINWFAHQPEQYRNTWLQYAHDWVREHDPNGHVQMPASRCLHTQVGDGVWWYFANDPSEKTPAGFGQEDAIAQIWAQEDRRQDQ